MRTKFMSIVILLFYSFTLFSVDVSAVNQTEELSNPNMDEMQSEISEFSSDDGLSNDLSISDVEESVEVELSPDDQMPIGEEEPEEGIEELSYTTHIQNYGWKKLDDMDKYSGAPGEELRLEGIIINAPSDLGLSYSVYVRNEGWQEMKTPGEIAGSTGESKPIDAIRIDISEETKVSYDIIYSVYVQSIGWLDWAENGAETGSIGISKHIEAISIKLIPKQETVNYKIRNLLLEEKKIEFAGHVQNLGWLHPDTNSTMVGTIGAGLRLEAIEFQNNHQDLGINHMEHIANIGWTSTMSPNALCGTVSKGLALEAIKLELYGLNSDYYDIFYRVHVQSLGWMEWTKNGDMAGTSGFSFRIEALEAKIIPKEANMIKSDSIRAKLVSEETSMDCTAHVQDIGWMNGVSNGNTAGTVGMGKRLEAIKISVTGNPFVKANYSTYVNGTGWQNPVADSSVAGTVGQSKFIEAIRINIEGVLSCFYNVYYRTHVSDVGWLAWSVNGNPNGTKGFNRQVEAVEVVILPRSMSFSGNVINPYLEYIQPRAQKSLVYYTTGQTDLYSSTNGKGSMLKIPKGSFLFGDLVNSSWLKTEYNGVAGYVQSGAVSGHVVTIADKTIIVNKRNSLPSSFAPGVNYEANQALTRMVREASNVGIQLNMFSGYRSYTYQNSLFNRYVAQDGRYLAETYSMRPGYSEHQTGLGFDIGGRDSSQWTKASFGRTIEGKWLKSYAPQYGFILRYPEGKEHITGIKYEPWHFRYVGVELATKLTQTGKTLDEYFDVVCPAY